MQEKPYLPTAVDIRLGDYFYDVTLDYDTIIQRMHDEGLTDEQIAQTNLTLSAVQPKEAQGTYIYGSYNLTKSEISLYPSLSADVDYLSAGIATLKAKVSERERRRFVDTNPTQTEFEAEARTLRECSRRASENMSETLYHELRHRRNHLLSPDKGKTLFFAKVLGRPMGAYAVAYASLYAAGNYIGDSLHLSAPAQFGVAVLSALSAMPAYNAAEYSAEGIYRINPDEVSARKAERDAEPDVVTVKYRTESAMKRRAEMAEKLAHEHQSAPRTFALQPSE